MLLKEIRLKASRLPVLADFYKNLLELPVVQQNADHMSVVAGSSLVTFDKSDIIESPFYHYAFNIPSNKFEEAFQWAQARMELLWLDDYNSYVADFVNWHAKSFYFKDPAGNILEFIARFDLSDDTDELFSPVHIRNVSEIGLVIPVDGFDATVNKLLSQYPLAYFDKQPPMPHFRAIGTDEGLLVIVPEDRIWFSTKNTVSRIFPTEIQFSIDGQLFELNM